MITVDAAKKLWCPMARCDGNNRHWGSSDANNERSAAPISACVADNCMMWQWTGDRALTECDGQGQGCKYSPTGYCGLTHKK